MKAYKILSLITLIFAALIFTNNIHAGKGVSGYKVSDMRQQKQLALQAAKHLQKMSTPNARFEQRHIARSLKTFTTTRQKVLALFFTAMLVNAEIVDSIPVTPKTPKNTAEETKASTGIKASTATGVFSTENIIHSVPYQLGQELETFGPCETLQDGSKFCSDIGGNYTVTCCHHPRTTGISDCVSFDPSGFIGEPAEQHPIDKTSKTLIHIKEICDARPNARYISEEIMALTIPRLLQNTNGTYCTKEIFGTDKTQNEVLRYPDYSMKESSLDGNCYGFGEVQVSAIDQSSGDFPKLVTMVKDLAQKYNLATAPRIVMWFNKSGHQG